MSTTSRGMTTMSESDDTGDDLIAAALADDMSVALPGLQSAERRDLAATASVELQLRVGKILDASLSDEQRREFRDLTAHELSRGKWLERALPHFRAVTAIERAALVAEIVREVLTADPALARAARPTMANVATVTPSRIRQVLDRRGWRWSRVGPITDVWIPGSGSRPELSVAIHVDNRGYLAFNCITVHRSYHASTRVGLAEFVNRWNAETVNPKAVLADVADGAGLHIYAEYAVPAAEKVTIGYLDDVIDRALGAMIEMFECVPEPAACE